MRVPRLRLALGLFLSLPACATPLSEARESFAEARYPDAVARYRALAPRVGQMPERELFEYALYRGLSHLALGDAAAAQRWLTVAKRVSETSPALATSDEHGRLLSAWRAMGHMPGD
jgi:hypothetical protein